MVKTLYQKQKQRDYDRKRKKKLKNFRNSYKKVCVRCGSTENLQLHHVDPHTKSKELTKMTDKKQIRELFENNEVLCKACHIDTFRKKPLNPFLKNI